MGRTLGQHLADRLSQVGVNHFFSVPGDYNLALLDELVRDKKLEGRWCCNELNAGYAADGYARVQGVGALVVTFTVGGLSAINAVAGAYAENQAVVCIVGAPNSNYLDGDRILHHTMGVHGNVLQELECFRHVTAAAVLIRSLDDAHEQIDYALSTAVRERKPVYLAVPSNLSALSHPSFDASPVPFSLAQRTSNPEGLRRAVEAAAKFLSKADKPVLIVGSLALSSKAVEPALALADASGFAIAALAAAKGLIPEDHEGYVGTYWGQASSPYTAELIESADAYVLIGAVLSDYATVGYTLNLGKTKTIAVTPYRVTIAGGKDGHSYGCVRMDDFLQALSQVVIHNDTSRKIFSRIRLPRPEVPASEEGSPLETRVLFKHVQRVLTPKSVLIAETGDSIFNCQKLVLPKGARYEWAQQYGSIGWSVGATLGASVAAALSGRRVVSCIGDGSFQVTAQDVSSMIRFGLNPIIFLVNNSGYTIEKEIHDGPKDNNYNDIQPWDYVAFVKAMHNGHGKLFATRVETEKQLIDAVDSALSAESDSLCFIECIIDPRDCSPELLEWGSRVSVNNSKPPIQRYD